MADPVRAFTAGAHLRRRGHARRAGAVGAQPGPPGPGGPGVGGRGPHRERGGRLRRARRAGSRPGADGRDPLGAPPGGARAADRRVRQCGAAGGPGGGSGARPHRGRRPGRRGPGRPGRARGGAVRGTVRLDPADRLARVHPPRPDAARHRGRGAPLDELSPARRRPPRPRGPCWRPAPWRTPWQDRDGNRPGPVRADRPARRARAVRSGRGARPSRPSSAGGRAGRGRPRSGR